MLSSNEYVTTLTHSSFGFVVINECDCVRVQYTVLKISGEYFVNPITVDLHPFMHGEFDFW